MTQNPETKADLVLLYQAIDKERFSVVVSHAETELQRLESKMQAADETIGQRAAFSDGSTRITLTRHILPLGADQFVGATKASDTPAIRAETNAIIRGHRQYIAVTIDSADDGLAMHYRDALALAFIDLGPVGVFLPAAQQLIPTSLQQALTPENGPKRRLIRIPVPGHTPAPEAQATLPFGDAINQVLSFGRQIRIDEISNNLMPDTDTNIADNRCPAPATMPRGDLIMANSQNPKPARPKSRSTDRTQRPDRVEAPEYSTPPRPKVRRPEDDLRDVFRAGKKSAQAAKSRTTASGSGLLKRFSLGGLTVRLSSAS